MNSFVFIMGGVKPGKRFLIRLWMWGTVVR